MDEFVKVTGSGNTVCVADRVRIMAPSFLTLKPMIFPFVPLLSNDAKIWYTESGFQSNRTVEVPFHHPFIQ